MKIALLTVVILAINMAIVAIILTVSAINDGKKANDIADEKAAKDLLGSPEFDVYLVYYKDGEIPIAVFDDSQEALRAFNLYYYDIKRVHFDEYLKVSDLISTDACFLGRDETDENLYYGFEEDELMEKREFQRELKNAQKRLHNEAMKERHLELRASKEAKERLWQIYCSKENRATCYRSAGKHGKDTDMRSKWRKEVSLKPSKKTAIKADLPTDDKIGMTAAEIVNLNNELAELWAEA